MLKRDEIADPNSCWNKARDDEYVFVLLARDESAPRTVRFWAADRIKHKANERSDAKIHGAYIAASEMEAEAGKGKSDAFVLGFSVAEALFYEDERRVEWPNPFKEGSDCHAGFEEGVYTFTQK